MSQLNWMQPKDGKGGGKVFEPLLRVVREEQPLHPGQWAEIRRYPSPGTARDRAWKLRKRWPAFQFRARKDPNTGEGAVFARYIGGQDAQED